MIQIIKVAAEKWTVHKLLEPWPGTYEYEMIGRVLLDGARYHIEVPAWNDKSFTWIRKSRSYQIPRGAFRALCQLSENPHLMAD